MSKPPTPEENLQTLRQKESEASMTELEKKINFIVESLAKKVDSLNYQDITYNQKVRAEAKQRIDELLSAHAQEERTVGELQLLNDLDYAAHKAKAIADFDYTLGFLETKRINFDTQGSHNAKKEGGTKDA